MDNNLDYHLLPIQYSIADNQKSCQAPDEKMNKYDSKLDQIITLLQKVLAQNKHSFPDNIYSPKSHYPTTMVPSNNKFPPLYGVNSTKIGGIWTIKRDIISPKFYELLIKTELKEDTALDIKKLYNHIKMYLNAMTRL